MKLVIFAGGTGRRLWPISRQSSPKQFEPIIEGKSTIQLALDRLQKGFNIEDIFVSTNDRYIGILKEQIPNLPEENFISEPARRDLAAAVGLSVIHLAHRYDLSDRIGIVWGDNYMTKGDTFLSLLTAADGIIVSDEANMVFIGETPRFANNNLGWIGIGKEKGKESGQSYYSYESWVYRPDLDLCQEMYISGKYVWNTGYFVTTLGFVVDLYQRYQPELWADLEQIGSVIGSSMYDETLAEIYPKLPAVSFDDAIVKKIELEEAVILHGDTGWSDPGTLYALKESINPDPDINVERGLVRAYKSADCLLYNYEPEKLLAVVGLEGMIVVNTEDAILVVHKDQIAAVKKLVDELIGSDLEKYT
jgi:mannose-1-phosphate guanylyltransferase